MTIVKCELCGRRMIVRRPEPINRHAGCALIEARILRAEELARVALRFHADSADARVAVLESAFPDAWPESQHVVLA